MAAPTLEDSEDWLQALSLCIHTAGGHEEVLSELSRDSMYESFGPTVGATNKKLARRSR